MAQSVFDRFTRWRQGLDEPDAQAVRKANDSQDVREVMARALGEERYAQLQEKITPAKPDTLNPGQILKPAVLVHGATDPLRFGDIMLRESPIDGLRNFVAVHGAILPRLKISDLRPADYLMEQVRALDDNRDAPDRAEKKEELLERITIAQGMGVTFDDEAQQHLAAPNSFRHELSVTLGALGGGGDGRVWLRDMRLENLRDDLQRFTTRAQDFHRLGGTRG